MNKKTDNRNISKTVEYGIIEFRSSLFKLLSAHLLLSLVLISLVWTIFPIPYFFWKYLQIKYSKYILTNQRLILRTGIFWRQINFLELYRVSDIQVQRGLLYQIVDIFRSCLHQKPLLLGDIWIFSTDYSHSQIFLDTIPNSLGVAEKIRQATNEEKDIKRVLRRD
ncbi:PH domain-containing protein [Scytonema sp. UIC 10036]|uniref:PH domain-containing protein n=1 Tax=Scytonema sp. UIC 10036 TaxID=2304196 RepID=UPI0012DAE908|nr:PH domain-containing protein [Scytonema sp. UIC 10036]MUG97245.1 PH domain-containing protein [Scytonema sp. UIC 10036]